MKKYKKSLLKLLIFILITFFIEIFICNYPAIRTLLAGNNNIEKDFIIENNKVIITNINKRVTSININYKNNLEDNITYNLEYKSEENSDTIHLNSKVLLKNDKQYINFDTHSLCEKIELTILTEEKINIDKIILNHVNFNINIFRVILIFGSVFFVYALKNDKIFEKEFDKNSKKFNIKFILKILIIFILISIYTIIEQNSDIIFIEKEKIKKDDSLLMQTESFMHGQVKLMEEPDERLLQMNNPYDHVKRNVENIPYLYDVAYYNGSYYNYFGVAPIITLILPFRIITGGYVQCYIFNLVYILGIMYALYFVYRKLVIKYIKNISSFSFSLGYFAILFGSNVLTLLRGAKYDIVITSGIMFTLISIYLSITLYENRKFKNIKLVLLGISLALMVLSKPTFIIYYLIVLYFITDSMKNIGLKEKCIDYIKIGIPLILFALFQMFLNYTRFGNIFEFGAKYQLTSFNMTSCMKLSFGKIVAGFLEYIFRTIRIDPLRFPFVYINTNTSLVTINEVLYENRLVGLISIPILWIYLFKKSILKDNKELNKLTNIFLICVFIEIVINTCFGGICEAYSIDFKLILCIIAVIIFFKFIEKNNIIYIKRLYVVLAVFTILIMLPISLTTEMNFLLDLRNSFTVYLKNMFEFWA